MQARVTLRPGQKGTRRLCEECGERLVCVRYRYDLERRLCVKTVEIVVGERPWPYSPRRDSPNSRTVSVALRYEEHKLRAGIKGAGGRWDPERGLWSLPLGAVRRLSLTKRIVSPAITDNSLLAGDERLYQY